MHAYTENIYTRKTLAGDFYVINQHLMEDLMKLGLWSDNMVDLIKYNTGSIANIKFIPENIREIYRTVWEIPQMSIIEMAADRGPYIDQTQSMNIFLNKPDYARLNTCLFHGWRLGLKTLIYYLRTKAGTTPYQFGIDIERLEEFEREKSSGLPVCKYVPKHMRKPGDCESCSS
jgi:ribonucleotide reductase alpha subunit